MEEVSARQSTRQKGISLYKAIYPNSRLLEVKACPLRTELRVPQLDTFNPLNFNDLALTFETEASNDNPRLNLQLSSTDHWGGWMTVPQRTAKPKLLDLEIPWYRVQDRMPLERAVKLVQDLNLRKPEILTFRVFSLPVDAADVLKLAIPIDVYYEFRMLGITEMADRPEPIPTCLCGCIFGECVCGSECRVEWAGEGEIW